MLAQPHWFAVAARSALVGLGMFGSPALAQTQVAATTPPADARQFDGDWVGKGSLQLGPHLVACSEVKMNFTGTPTLYVVGDATLTCESEKNTYPSATNYTVDANNDVSFKGKKVGRIDGNTIEFLAPDLGGAVTEVTIHRIGDLLYYYQVVRKPGEEAAYGAVAIMKKVTASN